MTAKSLHPKDSCLPIRTQGKVTRSRFPLCSQNFVSAKTQKFPRLNFLVDALKFFSVALGDFIRQAENCRYTRQQFGGGPLAEVHFVTGSLSHWPINFQPLVPSAYSRRIPQPLRQCT